ncbi:MAG: 50S ribosomal protein L24 [Planctomycetota bacterium]
MGNRIKRNDIVEVIRGDSRNKGRRGKVLSVDRKTNEVVIENINYVKKHLRRSQEHPRGGRVEREAPLDMSNVMPVCPACTRATRVAFVMVKEGDKSVKHRKCKKCETTF